MEATSIEDPRTPKSRARSKRFPVPGLLIRHPILASTKVDMIGTWLARNVKQREAMLKS